MVQPGQVVNRDEAGHADQHYGQGSSYAKARPLPGHGGLHMPLRRPWPLRRSPPLSHEDSCYVS